MHQEPSWPQIPLDLLALPRDGELGEMSPGENESSRNMKKGGGKEQGDKNYAGSIPVCGLC